MKPSFAPMIVPLALCGAMAVLTTGSAAAQTARTPAELGGSRAARMPAAADMAAQHKQMCQDAYAHQVGDLAYLEARLILTPAQQPLFDHWKSVKIDIAKRGAANCATRELPAHGMTRETPLDAMSHEEEMLKHRVADLDTERPVLSAFYNTLTEAQKMALLHPGLGPMMDRRRMFSQAMTPGMDPRHGSGMGGPDHPPGQDGPPQ